MKHPMTFSRCSHAPYLDKKDKVGRSEYLRSTPLVNIPTHLAQVVLSRKIRDSSYSTSAEEGIKEKVVANAGQTSENRPDGTVKEHPVLSSCGLEKLQKCCVLTFHVYSG
jgi:hypothetical protein